MDKCYYDDILCVSSLWQCQTCKEYYCHFHYHQTSLGYCVECVACERERLYHADDALLEACKSALADLEGIMPEFEPSGDRLHPGWLTIEELRAALTQAEGEK